MFNLFLTRWTSELKIYSEFEVSESSIDKILENISSILDYRNPKSLININPGQVELTYFYQEIVKSIGEVNLNKFINYCNFSDYTGVLKGLAIKEIAKFLKSSGNTWYLISFGNDIYSHGINNVRGVVSDKLDISIKSGDFCLFTSNNLVRPGHIKCIQENLPYDSITVLMVGESSDPIYADYLATHSYSNKQLTTAKVGTYIIPTLNNLPNLLHLIGYCASPFFTPEERKIRDKMYSYLSHCFRPDSTESSKSYSSTPGSELAKLIYEENINHVAYCDFLMFPEGTNDLGTLFEVFYANSLGKLIFRYSYLEDKFTMLLPQKVDKIKEDTLIKLNKLGSVVSLGTNVDTEHKLYYDIGKLHDNIMLNVPFTSVTKLNENTYIQKEVNYKEVD